MSKGSNTAGLIKLVERMAPLAKEPVLGLIQRNGKPVNDTSKCLTGRPPGSSNRKNKELAAYILSKHRNPVEAAAEIVDAPITDLAEKLECTKLEAAMYWKQCAEFVARYTCSTMPAQVNVSSPLAGYLTIVNLASPRPGEETNISAYGLDMQVKGKGDETLIEHQETS